MRPYRTNYTLKTTDIVWCPMRDSKIIWTLLSTQICERGRPRKYLNIGSSLPPVPTTTHIHTEEELRRRQRKRSRKLHNVKKYSAPFEKDLECITKSNTPTLMATAIVLSTRRIILAPASLTATLSLRSSRNRINPVRRNSRGPKWIPNFFINLRHRL